MHWLKTLFTIYLFVLSAYPCQDLTQTCSGESIDICQTDTEKSNETESCSPLCSCECCQTVLSINQSLHLGFSKNPNSSEMAFFGSYQPFNKELKDPPPIC
ncbi:DUF6660 family protein [Penaeicola halotolerans]|uniref:DUF6660 family protein n=1 Tax=Penaeicola halotolerans TaxID=2793196 RepID=UPI0034DB327B